jgi:hypothetical protein
MRPFAPALYELVTAHWSLVTSLAMSFGIPKQPAPEKKVLNIDADQTNTNQQAIPVPYMAGRNRVAIQYIAPVYNQVNKPVKTQVGKGDSQTTGYTYYGDFAGLICMGGRVPLAKIFKQIVDSEIAWHNDAGLDLGTDAAVPVTVDKYGQTYLYSGTENQAIDPHVLTPKGVTPTTVGYDPRDPTTWPGGDDETNQHPPP